MIGDELAGPSNETAMFASSRPNWLAIRLDAPHGLIPSIAESRINLTVPGTEVCFECPHRQVRRFAAEFDAKRGLERPCAAAAFASSTRPYWRGRINAVSSRPPVSFKADPRAENY